MNYEYVTERNGLTRHIKIKSIPYDLIEVTFKTKLIDEKGEIIVDNGHTGFFERKEFVELFEQLIIDMKGEIENANSIEER